MNNPIPAKYTEVLGNIVAEGYNLFDFDYNSVLDKTELQNGFTDYWYFREIGFETVEMFAQRLRVRWQNIIERYNLIFQADQTLTASDAFEDESETEDETINNERTTNANGQSVFNDAPLGVVTFDNSHASAITNSEQGTTDNFSETKNRSRSALHKSKAQALADFDAALRDHKKQFFEEFKDLFFGLY